MAKHLWTIFCSSTSVDGRTNNLSLFEILEQVQIHSPLDSQWPRKIPLNGSVVSTWIRDDIDEPEKATSQLIFVAPNGDSLFEGESEIDLTQSSRNRLIVEFQGLNIAGPGVHHFQVYVGDTEGEWSLVFELPLDVDVITNPEG